MSAVFEQDNIWLGDTPPGWSLLKLRHLADFVNGAAFKPSEWGDEGTPIVRIQNLNGGDEFNFTRRTLPVRYHVRQGDLLFGWSGNRGTSFGPFLWGRSGHYYLNQHIFRVVERDCLSGWLFWVLKAVTHEVEERAHGIIGMVHITRPELDTIRVPVPPLPAQRAIANFLDKKTKALDDLIQRKERLIELLAEKRQALITQAVTKGLDPSVPMKDSVVPWCPRVPAHWSLPRNKELLRIRKTAVGGRHLDYQLLSLTKRGVIVRDVDSHMGKHLVDQGANQEVREGDLVFCFFDVDETPRTVGLSRWFGMISPDYTVLCCDDRLTAEYLEYFYIAMDDRKLLRPLYTGLRKRISKPEFLSSAVPLPPTEERQAIVTHLRNVLARDELLLGKTAESVEKLKEYRQALISAAVTGQVDVDGEAA